MSQFSGKCDLYDSVIAIGKYDINDIELYLSKDGRNHRLKLVEPRDLIPYYPYVPFMSTGCDGKYVAWISESFVDREEREMLESELEWLLKDYRRAKRNKTPFNPDSQWYNKALIKRVAELGEKATIEGIHRPISNHYRRDLAEEMEKNGYEDIDIIKWIYPEKWFEKLSKGWDWRTDEY